MQSSHLEDLRGLLAHVRRRWMTATSMRAAARAAAVALGFLLLVLAIDRFAQPQDGPMVAFSFLAVIAAASYVVRTLWPLRRSPTNKQVARFIEERCPDLEDRLASATEMADLGHTSPLGQLMVGDAAERARRVDVDRVVAGDHVRRSVLRGAAAMLAFLGVFAAGSEPVGRIARSAWLYAFPYSATLSIEPGAARVVAGDPLRVEARIDGTVGAPSRTPPSLIVTDRVGAVETHAMRETDGVFEAVIPSVEADFTYRVTAATLASDEFAVTALFAPEVDRIDVAYQYPTFANLPPRIETDGGDIYAPIGTVVTVTVHLDKPVEEGALTMERGSRLALESVSPQALVTTFEVSGDDTYRVAVVDADGLSSDGDVDYFIRTVLDRPPDIEVLRPFADREITPLEEVVIEARADDDFGLERFELVYTVVGESDRAVSLLDASGSRHETGSHTIYAEALDIAPGDFISYYVRALDTNTGRAAGEVRSDIYFLEVRPFDQEFEEAQSQATSAMDAGAVDDLAAVQKQIIVATWKLDRQGPQQRAEGDLTTVADAQEELKWATQRMTERILGRGRAIDDGGRGRPSTETQAMRDAIAAMEEAEAHLRAARTTDAVPPEMVALNQLLKAQAEIRRKQVSTQQGNDGGQGGATQAQEDLSALFDQELRRDQETNYEERSRPGDQEQEEETDADRRLRELAERQRALATEQESLAEEAPELSADELRRQLERLTREQNELRRDLEDLERQADSPSGQTARRLGEVSEQMRRAVGDMRRGDLSRAAERSQSASARLQEVQREAERGSSRAPGAALGELELEARQLAGVQRQISTDARQMPTGQDGREARRDLSGQGDRLADRVESLEDRIEDLVPRSQAEAGEALTEAAAELRVGSVAGQNRQLADQLRQMGDEQSATAAAEAAETSDELAEVLESVAGRLAEAGQEGSPNQRLSAELERVQELRERLEEIEQQLAQMSASDGADPGDAPPAPSAQGGEPDGETGSGESEAEGEQSADGAAQGERRGGMPGRGELAALQQQLLRQLAESPGLLDTLEQRRPTAQQDLEQWSQHWQSGAAPGTETFKQDLSTWERLQDDLQIALDLYEESRTRELRDGETAGRLNVGPDESMPEAYRRLVEDYYRSIATQSR